MVIVGFYTFYPAPKFLGLPFTIDNFVQLIRNVFFWNDLLSTLKLSFGASIISVLLAFPLAQLLVRPGQKSLKRAITVIVILSLFVSSIVRSAAWLLLLSNTGIVNSTLIFLRLIHNPLNLLYNPTAVLVGMISFNMPYAILTLVAGLRLVGVELENAARTLGANEFQVFGRVTLRLSALPLASSATLMFVVSLASFVSPLILGGGVVPFTSVDIYTYATIALNYPESGAIAALFTIVVLTSVFAFERIIGTKSRVVRVR
jgi:putative spermidine/putrescine transport system permease protein